MELSIKGLKLSDGGEITSIKCKGTIRKYLLDLGIIKGELIELEKLATLGEI